MAGDEKPIKFAELTPALAVIGAIAGTPIAVLKASGLADDFGAAYGVAIKDLIWAVTCGAALLIAFVFLWYFETLGGGAEAAGSGLRARFDRERARLTGYRAADDGYAQRLKTFLAWIDRFFDGDNLPSQRARILVEPAHVWTAAAYDRCLLLALVYPIVAIFFSWVLTGHVGPAESALGLKEADGWLRTGTAGSLVLLCLSVFKLARAQRWRKLSWFFVYSAAVAFFFVFAGPLPTIFSFVSVNAVAFAATGASATMLVAASGAGAAIPNIVVAGTVFAIGATAALVTISLAAVVTVILLSIRSDKGGWRGLFLGLFTTVMFALCLVAAHALSTTDVGQHGWNTVKAELLFLGVFTLINAPFDWLSLGLTRLLLRYGIEKGGYWPYALAVVDAVAASALITILALAMARSNDLFNLLAEQGGGEEVGVLPPSSFYLGMLERGPAAPEFWWLYATLFSTMIPSVINLFIAGFSFLRTLPWSRNFVLANMREGDTMPIVARLISSSILTAQVALAWPVAIFFQFILTYVVLWQIMPRLGLGILHLAETLGFV